MWMNEIKQKKQKKTLQYIQIDHTFYCFLKTMQWYH